MRLGAIVSACAATGFAVPDGAVYAKAGAADPIGRVSEFFKSEARNRCPTTFDNVWSIYGDEFESFILQAATTFDEEVQPPWWYWAWLNLGMTHFMSKEDRIGINMIVVSSTYLGSLIEVVALSEDGQSGDADFEAERSALIDRTQNLYDLAMCLKLEDGEKDWLSSWMSQAYEAIEDMECGQWFAAGGEMLRRLSEEPLDQHRQTFDDLIGWPTKNCMDGARQ